LPGHENQRLREALGTWVNFLALPRLAPGFELPRHEIDLTEVSSMPAGASILRVESDKAATSRTSEEKTVLSTRAAICFIVLTCAGPLTPAARSLDPPRGEPTLAGGDQWSPPPSRISDETRRRIWERIARHRDLVGTREPAATLAGVPHPLFAWPLRPAPTLTDDGYHAIDAFVDHDPSFPDGLSDYECGTRTYDTPEGYNHRGSDFFSWPFAWLKVDQDAIEVVAAADGTIIDRGDGNFDHRCGCQTDDPNYVIVEHADGSTVWTADAPEGEWTFSATYQGQTFDHRFDVGFGIFADGFESGDLSSW
jgi:hypothetical protein